MKQVFLIIFSSIFFLSCKNEGSKISDSIADAVETQDVSDISDSLIPEDIFQDIEPQETEETETDSYQCESGDTSAYKIDLSKDKFVLSLYHFNIQYVAGGLKGFVENDPEGKYDLSEEQLEDQIIIETFEPLLDILLEHASWGVDIELQGYMIEILQQRFPKVLNKLRTLAVRGQIDIVSFHYSDQLFLAYPRLSMEKSYLMTKNIFDQTCLPLSPSVFTQEGQFGEGMAPFMKDHGYNIGILPKNLFKYLHENYEILPYYRLHDTFVVLGGQGFDYKGNKGNVKVSWSFFDDGELALTGKANPYTGKDMKCLQSAKEELIKEYSDYEKNGYVVTTISRYVEYLQEKGFEAPELPPVLDSDWQPSDTQGLYRWMGGTGLFFTTERDNEVLTGNVRTEHLLHGAEILADFAKDKGNIVTKYEQGIKEAWRHLLFAEVSDSTGWNPWKGEVQYSLAHSKEAENITAQIIDAVKKILGASFVRIDTKTGSVEILKEKPPDPELTEVSAPLEITVNGVGYIPEMKWEKVEENEFLLTVTFKPDTGMDGILTVAFPGNIDMIVFSPSLMEDKLVEYDLSMFTFKDFCVPLSNGIIGIAADEFIIKHTDTVHIAACLSKDSGSIDFTDNTEGFMDQKKDIIWKFTYVKGSKEKALETANKINVYPVLVF